MDRPVAYRVMREMNAVRIVEFTYTNKTPCWYRNAQRIRDVLDKSYYFATDQFVGEVADTLPDAVALAKEHVTDMLRHWQEIAERLRQIAE